MKLNNFEYCDCKKYIPTNYGVCGNCGLPLPKSFGVKTKEYPKNCPFCRIVLPIINRIRATWCNNCGASWVQKCPNCGNPTWMSLKKEFKHTIKTNCK